MSSHNPETTTDNRPEVEIFTEAEHVALADYLNREPLCETQLSSFEALEELGIPEELDHTIFYSSQAAAAQVVLRNAQRNLPQFAAVDPKKASSGTLYEAITLAREIRPDPARRKVELISQHLFTIDWAASAPGFSWPEAYYATWVPLYEVALITVSGDCPEAYGGYCDLAIGWALGDDDLAERGTDTAAGLWRCFASEIEQERWDFVLDEGIVSRAQAEAAADELWGPRPKPDRERLGASTVDPEEGK